MACGRCYGVYYCNTECQRADWAEHKKYCRKQASSTARVADAMMHALTEESFTDRELRQFFRTPGGKPLALILALKAGEPVVQILLNDAPALQRHVKTCVSRAAAAPAKCFTNQWFACAFYDVSDAQAQFVLGRASRREVAYVGVKNETTCFAVGIDMHSLYEN